MPSAAVGSTRLMAAGAYYIVGRVVHDVRAGTTDELPLHHSGPVNRPPPIAHVRSFPNLLPRTRMS